MIDELVAAVNLGQPRSIVVGWCEHHAQDLRRRVMDELRERGPGMLTWKCHERVQCEGSEIIFAGAQRAASPRFYCGRCGDGWFWDHACFELADDFLYGQMIAAMAAIARRQGFHPWDDFE